MNRPSFGIVTHYWKQDLLIVSPETVVRWHRSGFALYWRAISRARRIVGRKRISNEVRELIFRMVAENPVWGAMGASQAWFRCIRESHLALDAPSPRSP